jgi:DNA polymerase IV
MGIGTMRVILHLDMDAFYASVEQRDQPELQGKPVIVGSPPNQRGVVCACSYEARRFGIHSAMPSITAGRLCPNGIFIRPRMDSYRQESRCIMKILADTGASLEQTSVDEAYLDLSAQCVAQDTDESLLLALPVARKLKQRISSERQLTASIGLASNKLLAKLASDFKKPNGLTLIPERDKVLFLRPMPVRVLYGVGKVTENILKKAGINTVGELQDYPGDLRELVGSFGPTLKRFGLGEDDRPLDLNEVTKSISSETTFLHDTEDRQLLRATLREQAAEISAELVEKQLMAKTVQVRVRYGDFTTLSRQVTVEEPIREMKVIYRLGCSLLAWHKLVTRPLRLLGLGVSHLVPPREQLWLPLDNHGSPLD